MGNPDFALLTEDRLLEINREVIAEVVTLLGTAAALATRRSAAGTAETAEKGLEQIGEPAHIAHVGHAGGAAEACFPKLVVPGFGLGITQDLVGTTDLLETVLGTGFLVDIRVVLTRKAPVGPLERVGISIATDTKQVIEIGHYVAIPFITLEVGIEASVLLLRSIWLHRRCIA